MTVVRYQHSLAMPISVRVRAIARRFGWGTLAAITVLLCGLVAARQTAASRANQQSGKSSFAASEGPREAPALPLGGRFVVGRPLTEHDGEEQPDDDHALR